jgi:outer membrane protein TolC
LRTPAAVSLALSLAASLLVSVTAGAQEGLTIEQAVARALSKDPGIEGASLDWMSASAKADALGWKRYPSLSASAGAQYLSPLPASSITLGPTTIALPTGLPYYISLGLNLQYVVYDGSRLRENLAIAGLQVQAKDLARESAKRALVFDVRRAYWEAVRATHNRATLEQNLELMKLNGRLADQQLGQGVATRADQLAAQLRLEQAGQDLGDATSAQKRAFLSLASLTGGDLAAMGISRASELAPLPFKLETEPDEAALGAAAPPDEAALVASALARRPETRAMQLARRLAERSAALARAALYPTVALTGNVTLADPNQRAAFQTTSRFLATGTIGIQVSYDAGGLPATLDDVKAQDLALSKAKSDETRQRNAVVMDVEGAIVNLERARADLASTSAMVEQARENLRVVQGRVAAGSAKDIDLRSSRFELLRMEFAVTNRRIDALIAQADLSRAAASEDVE